MNSWKETFLNESELISLYTLDQSEPGSNGNKRVLHIPKSSRTGASPSEGLELYYH